MKTYKILGSKGQIGSLLKKEAPKSWTYKEEGDVDFLFIAKQKKFNYKAKHTIDLTSHSKQSELENFHYGFTQYFNTEYIPNISNPGCSALGILYAIYPMRELVSNLETTVRFPLSSMQKNSPNRKKAFLEGSFVLDRPHYHKAEVEKLINQEIKFTSLITNTPEGMKIRVSGNKKSTINVETFLRNFYTLQDNIIVKPKHKLTDVIKTPNIIISVIKEDDTSFELWLSLDNVYFSVHNALEQCKGF